MDEATAKAVLRFGVERKEVAAAYTLWLPLGLLGAHRFYLGHKQSGLIMALLTVSVVGLIASAIWYVVDLFLIASMTEERNRAIAVRMFHKSREPNEY
ncbi:MAG: TM2 domain-containing protein [Maricaulaceae bacterium]